jgi:hypothetical protein
MGRVDFRKLPKVAILDLSEKNQLIYSLFSYYIWDAGIVRSGRDWDEEYDILLDNRGEVEDAVADGLDKELRDVGLDGVVVAAEFREGWLVIYGGKDFVNKIDVIDHYMHIDPVDVLRRPILSHFDHGVVFSVEDQEEFMDEAWDEFLKEHSGMSAEEIIESDDVVYDWMEKYFDKELVKAGVDWVVLELEGGSSWEILWRGSEVFDKLDPFKWL